jgi:branched-chain amino acid transport system substrate-binding protein
MLSNKKFHQYHIVLILFLISALLLSACGETSPVTSKSLNNLVIEEQAQVQPLAPQPQQGNVIRIYSSLPLTGSSKDQSQTLVNAIQMALDDIGGPEKTVAGFKIDYVSLDDATAQAGQWDANQEMVNANKAASDPDAMAYIGTFNSGAAKISIPVLNKAGLAMISPANTYPGLTRKVEGLTEANEPSVYYPTNLRNYFRVVVGDDVQGPAMVAFAANTIKAKRFYVIDDSQTYGKGLADVVSRDIQRRGLSLVGRESIGGRENNFRDLARRVRAAKPDFIIFGGDAQTQPGRMLADIRASGVSAPFMGGDGLNDPAFIKEAGVAGEGSYSSISGIPADKLPAKGQDFLKRYQARFGAPTNYTIYGYESMAVLLNAIKTAGKKDRKTILDAIARTKDYDGVLGRWSFDSNGDTSLTDISVYQIQDGLLIFRQLLQSGKS